MPAVPILRGFSARRSRLDLVAVDDIAFEAFVGSTFRGGFGHVFKERVCTWSVGACDRCASRAECAYPPIFEPAPPPDATKLRNLEQIPRPYVIEAPRFGPGPYRVRAGESFALALVLIGRAIDVRDELLAVLDTLGARGVGPGRGRYRVRGVAAEAGIDCDAVAAECTRLERALAAGGPLTVELLTPLRVKVDGRIVRTVSFPSLVRAALRRLSSLLTFHCGEELDADYRGLIDAAEDVVVADQALEWCDRERVSGRQHRRIEMGGPIGRVRYSASDPRAFAPFLPLLVAAQWTHLGKGAVMGLGGFSVAAG